MFEKNKEFGLLRAQDIIREAVRNVVSGFASNELGFYSVWEMMSL